MKIFAALLALISAQCSWDYDKENKIITYSDKNTGTVKSKREFISQDFQNFYF